MLFTSDSGTLWWYSNRTKIDGLCISSSWLEEIHLSQRTFMELPIHIGTWTDSGRKGERQRPSGSLSNTNESFWTQPGRGYRNQRFHSSTESTSSHSLEIYTECGRLGTIIKSAGSTIGIRADKFLEECA